MRRMSEGKWKMIRDRHLSKKEIIETLFVPVTFQHTHVATATTQGKSNFARKKQSDGKNCLCQQIRQPSVTEEDRECKHAG